MKPSLLLPSAFALCVLLLPFTYSCKPKNKYVSLDGTTWGTTYHIVYNGPASLADSVEASLARTDSLFSMFNPESELSRVNRGETLSVGPEFVYLFNEAREIWDLTEGVYDCTVAPLVDLWGFGPSEERTVPDSAAVEACLGSVGMGDCSVSDGGWLHLKSDDTRLDFSSLAKGYGIDCIGAMLDRNGCTDYMIEIGGEILVRGQNPRADRWQIQIDSPASDALGHERLIVLPLGPEKTALASSGNYRNYRTDSLGHRRGHTIDPRTGYPHQSSTLATSVLAPTCARADALATACMLVAPDEAVELAPAAGAEVMVVMVQDSVLCIQSSGGFPGF